MDIMKWYDILFLGVPETTLSIFIILSILDNKIGFRNKFFYVKLILSNIVILSVIFLSRGFFNNLIYTSLVSMMIYTLCFKGIWEYNWRQSIFGGAITIFFLMSIEIMTYPIITLVLENFEYMSFFGNRVILFIPARVLQILVLVFIKRYNITLKNNDLMILKWDSFSKDQKVNISIMLFSITTCVQINTSYGDLYVQAALNKIDSSLIPVNMKMLFFGSIIMIFCILVLMFRTIRYEEYKSILRKTPEEFMRRILENSTHEELQSYSKIFLEELQFARVEQVEKYLQHMTKTYPNLTYEIDENIVFANMDYSDIMHYIDQLIASIDKSTKLFFAIKSEKTDFAIILKAFEVTELQYKTLQNSAKRMVYIKKDITMKLQATVNLNYLNNNAICEIIIPLINDYRKEAYVHENE